MRAAAFGPDNVRRHRRGRCGWRRLLAGVASNVQRSIPTSGGGHGLDSDPSTRSSRTRQNASGDSPRARPVSARRHLAWLVGGMAGAFLVPFVLADQLGLQRDLYYALYVAAVVGLFFGVGARHPPAAARDVRPAVAARRRPRRRVRGDQRIHRDPRRGRQRRTPAASSSSLRSAGAASSTAQPTACCCRRSRSCSSSPRCATAACVGEPAGSSPSAPSRWSRRWR